MANNEIMEIADTLVKRLLAEGFIIHRYDATSTNSVYLKLDYGVCNSIRISDHPGKKHLKYRYNIGPFITEYKQVKDKWPRFYYKSTKTLIKKIIADRKEKQNKYGIGRYLDFMSRNKHDKSNNKGFWTQAHRVRL